MTSSRAASGVMLFGSQAAIEYRLLAHVEERELVLRGIFYVFVARFGLFLELHEELLRAAQHRGWDAREARDLDAVGAVGGRFDYLVQEDYAAGAFVDAHAEIYDSGQKVGER